MIGSTGAEVDEEEETTADFFSSVDPSSNPTVLAVLFRLSVKVAGV